MKTTTTKKVEGVTKDSLLNRFLGGIERAGNILPHPATLFVILALLVIILSAVTSWMGVSVMHPGTKEVVRAESLLTIPGPAPHSDFASVVSQKFLYNDRPCR